ncbi:hypothetical protein M3Y99_01511500 [Aphelenchoides fujianensis]|nr:hypothetical protein M3Y99_01511500 [Aphelenchoides fujianensis]
MSALGAQQQGFMYGVPCDNASLASFPNLVLSLYGQDFKIGSDYYVDTDFSYQNLCEVLIDETYDDTYDVVVPEVFEYLICEFEKMRTDPPTVQKSQVQAIREHQRLRNIRKHRMARRQRPLKQH